MRSGVLLIFLRKKSKIQKRSKLTISTKPPKTSPALLTWMGRRLILKSTMPGEGPSWNWEITKRHWRISTRLLKFIAKMLKLSFWKELHFIILMTTQKLLSSAKRGREWRSISSKHIRYLEIAQERTETISRLLKAMQNWFSWTRNVTKLIAREALSYWSKVSTKRQLDNSTKRLRLVQAMRQLFMEEGRHLKMSDSPRYPCRTIRQQLRPIKSIFFVLQV